MSLERKIIEKERALLTNEVRHSKQKLRSLLSSQFMEIGSSGDFIGLNKVLEQLPQNKTWHCHIQDIELNKISSEVVQLIYLAFIKKNDTDEGTFSRRSSIWHKEDNQWKMYFHQGTPVSLFDLKT